MIRCSEIIEKPILINGKNKESLSTVYDVILSSNSKDILGFIWKKKLLKKDFGIILFDDISLISQEGLHIKNQNTSKDFDYNNLKYFGLSYIHDVLNKIVLNSEGEVVGIIRDVFLDIGKGQYSSFEISEGYIDDIMTGRKLVEVGTGYRIDSHALLLYDSSIIQNQGKGLVNMTKLT